MAPDKAETAKDFGVFFTPRENPQQLALFLQKPSPARIRELAVNHLYLVDTGMWLLSQRAIELLLHAPVGPGDVGFQFVFLDGIEQLWQPAGKFRTPMPNNLTASCSTSGLLSFLSSTS